MLPLFDGGLRRAQLRHSWSQYAQTRDNYRATVLAAFQEVEDGLSQTQRLATEDTQEHEASDQAVQALSISTMLYKDGLDNYLSVVGCAGAGTRRATHRGPDTDPPDPGGRVADSRIGRRMDCASTARRKADPGVRTARLRRVRKELTAYSARRRLWMQRQSELDGRTVRYIGHSPDAPAVKFDDRTADR